MMSKLTLVSGLVLGSLVITAACSPLPPSAAQTPRRETVASTAQDMIAPTAPPAVKLMQTGIEAYGNGNYGVAIALLDRAIAGDPMLAEAYYYRGLAHARQGNYAQAVSDFDRAIEVEPKSLPAYDDNENSIDSAGKLKEAVTDFNTASKLDPTVVNVDYYMNRGYLLGRLSRFAEAIEDFTRVIELDPKNPKAYYYRGLANMRQGFSARAIRDLERYLELAPDASDGEEIRELIKSLQ